MCIRDRENSKQIRRKPFIIFSNTWFYHIVINVHNKHLHKAYKAFFDSYMPFLYDRVTNIIMIISKALQNNREAASLVIDISNGRTSLPAASFSTILPLYLPSGAMENPSCSCPP